MESSPRILLIREVATLLRVASVTVHRWLAERRAGRGHFPLPISQRGRKLRWLAADIEAFLQFQSEAASPVNPTPPNTSSPAQHQRRERKEWEARQLAAAETLQRHRTSRSR